MLPLLSNESQEKTRLHNSTTSTATQLCNIHSWHSHKVTHSSKRQFKGIYSLHPALQSILVTLFNSHWTELELGKELTVKNQRHSWIKALTKIKFVTQAVHCTSTPLLWPQLLGNRALSPSWLFPYAPVSVPLPTALHHNAQAEHTKNKLEQITSLFFSLWRWQFSTGCSWDMAECTG